MRVLDLNKINRRSLNEIDPEDEELLDPVLRQQHHEEANETSAPGGTPGEEWRSFHRRQTDQACSSHKQQQQQVWKNPMPEQMVQWTLRMLWRVNEQYTMRH